MNRMLRWLSLVGLGLLAAQPALAQQPRDRSTYIEYNTSYYLDVIEPAVDPPPAKKKSWRVLKADLTGRNFPTDPQLYQQVWHQPPVSQGKTSTCWCYATTSFYESEVKRLTGREVRLSTMYTVYWEYVERARYFVQQRGQMFLGEGSETNAVARMMKRYGIVPEEQYSCLRPGQQFPDHTRLFAEVETYLKSVKQHNAWNEAQVVATVRAILDHHLGPPPTEVVVDGKKLTPLQYLNEVLKIRPDDYVDFMSLLEKPQLQRAEYEVPDNWWKSDVYHNVPLDQFMQGLKQAIRRGFSVAIGGDFSEPGLEGSRQVAIVPTFDIPADYIDEHARQLRFSNRSTTDDHAVHLVGVHTVDGKDWFLCKDSGAGSRNGAHPGYYFIHEDYVKLKIMTYTVHKDAVRELLAQFP